MGPATELFKKTYILIILLLWLWIENSVRGTALRLHGDFDTQVRHLISQEMLSPEQVRLIMPSFDELQKILRSRWEGAELFAFGSLLVGLATKTSDVDFYLRIPNNENNTEAYFAEETAKILQKYPEKYMNIVFRDIKVPLVTCYDVSLQRHIDISFRSNAGVEKTRLLAYYINLDKRFLPLIVVIKLWCKYNNLVGKGVLPNYAVYLMVIFYLQQKNLSPSSQLIQMQAPPLIIRGWNMNFKEIPFSIENNDSLYDLLGGFFKYYNDFNFKEYCVSGFVGRPVHKKDLEDTDRIPHEFSLYKNYLKADECKPIALQTVLCVQDIYVHHSNVGRRLDEVNYVRFMNHIRYAAKAYDELYSSMFLSEILFKSENAMLSALKKHKEAKYTEL